MSLLRTVASFFVLRILDIHDHSWFQDNGCKYKSLLRKDVTPPWVPKIKDPLDASHFDSYRHMENEPPSNKPHLSATQQAMFTDF